MLVLVLLFFAFETYQQSDYILITNISGAIIDHNAFTLIFNYVNKYSSLICVDCVYHYKNKYATSTDLIYFSSRVGKELRPITPKRGLGVCNLGGYRGQSSAFYLDFNISGFMQLSLVSYNVPTRPGSTDYRFPQGSNIFINSFSFCYSLNN